MQRYTAPQGGSSGISTKSQDKYSLFCILVCIGSVPSRHHQVKMFLISPTGALLGDGPFGETAPFYRTANILKMAIN